MKLSIIIPCYNEEKTIKKIIDRIFIHSRIKNKEIIVVDDGSTDNTVKILKKIKNRSINIIYQKINSGKGKAIQVALKHITGKIVIIQDADLEYHPKDYRKLIKPIINKEHLVVYGSRVLSGKSRYSFKNGFYSIFRILMNHILTIFSNFLNSQKLTDAHTCYKVFNVEILKKISLEHNDFSFCPELTTKISKLKIKIKELPIYYKGRNYEEGKKIRFTDGIIAIYTIIKFRFK
jgi:glycosyltransferase involved in cell wall biosynthesis|tara:strand:+ start:1490 stop:2191 length:702 start_codon:yes stop_codon:yes gene_type:complete